MKFDDAAQLLVAQRWTHEADLVTSPSCGFWFDRATLERDVRAVYDPAARRVYSGRTPEAHELYILLRVLARDPILAALDSHLTSLKSELAAFASAHAMTISLWEFGYPSVRATAKHPTGGVAVVECTAGAAPAFELQAYHWIDDHDHGVRLSRGEHFPGTDLRMLLGAVHAFLLASPDRTSFQSSTLTHLSNDQRAQDEEHWRGLSVLQ